jgi:hypothetical protein
MRLVFILIILLALTSQRIVYNVVLYPMLEWKIENQNAALRGEIGAPYQYRILKPVVCKLFDSMLRPLIKDEVSRYKIIYKGLLIALFFSIYLLFFLFLKNFFCDMTSIIGLLLLQVLVPLATTANLWEEGDYINLLFYLLALYVIFKNREYWLPLIVAVAALNREQAIYILVFYAAYAWEQKKLFKSKSVLLIMCGAILYGAVVICLRLYFGYKPNPFTVSLVTKINLTEFSIIRLWVEQVLIFVILSIASYKKSRLFFKLAFLSLIPYTVLFFFFGVAGELAKFLPAFVIMITMTLQLFKGEYTKPGLRSSYDN